MNIVQMIKKQYNAQFVIMTIIFIIGTLFFYTTKLYMGDDRAFIKTESVLVKNVKVEMKKIVQADHIVEILFTNEQKKVDEQLPYTISLYVNNQKKEQIAYEIFSYVFDGTQYNYVTFQLTEQQEKKLHYFTLVFGEEEQATKMKIDYRAIEKYSYIAKKDVFLVRQLENNKLIETLKQTKRDIYVTLKKDTISDVQEKALLEQIEQINLQLRGLEE